MLNSIAHCLLYPCPHVWLMQASTVGVCEFYILHVSRNAFAYSVYLPLVFLTRSSCFNKVCDGIVEFQQPLLKTINRARRRLVLLVAKSLKVVDFYSLWTVGVGRRFQIGFNSLLYDSLVSVFWTLVRLLSSMPCKKIIKKSVNKSISRYLHSASYLQQEMLCTNIAYTSFWLSYDQIPAAMN